MAVGLLVCAAWYYTILAGFYILYCPVMYLMFLNHICYRKVVDVLFALWELFPVALFQWCCNTELHHYGDYVDPNETTIIVMNHRTRVDWNYVWIALYHATQKPYKNVECICKGKFIDKPPDVKSDILDVMARGKSKIKFVLKDEIKSIPGMGWIMQLNYFLYVKRNWQEDQVNMSQFVDYYKRLRYQQRVVLFPEGTDLSDDNKRKSQKYALSKKLPNYEYVLHPRTTGWAVLCSRMRSAGLVSVYDVTVAYDTPAQTELDLLRGNLPKHVHFHFKRHPIEDLPCEEDELRIWLQDRWKEKNISLERFHREGTFIDFVSKNPPKKNESKSLHMAKLAFIFWTIIDISFLYFILFSVLFKFWVIYHTLLFLFVTKYFGGFHNIQYRILDKVNFYEKLF
ncbi:lysocardiolipin acyltransferase 1-like isoform X1 [Pararge aegeria]|uniref:lysocardiolipin acyltransferase 1-like isoform X1 n=2 Tax=Pararge aegeria TaxID=116150 RepID=UPI0019D19FAF|nr:lysocardiolipin acyltransferase 1-like isoform X1 [Pararge aegeria]